MKRIIKAKKSGKRYGFIYTLECNECHKDFQISGYRFNDGVGKFCSFSCRTRYRMKRLTGNKSYNWRGGRIKTSYGYVRVYAPNHPHNRFGYVLEHRLIIEKKIGRYLKPTEVVHHKNEITGDNRIENLELLDYIAHNRNHGFQKHIPRNPITGRFIKF